MRVVDLTWTIGPVFRHEGSALQLGGFRRRCSASAASGCPRSSAIWPGARSCRRNDPYFKEAMAHGGH